MTTLNKILSHIFQLIAHQVPTATWADTNKYQKSGKLICHTIKSSQCVLQALHRLKKKQGMLHGVMSGSNSHTARHDIHDKYSNRHFGWRYAKPLMQPALSTLKVILTSVGCQINQHTICKINQVLPLQQTTHQSHQRSCAAICIFQ